MNGMRTYGQKFKILNFSAAPEEYSVKGDKFG